MSRRYVPIVALVFAVAPITSAFASQCFPAQHFASVGLTMAGQIQVEIDPGFAQGAGHEIGRFWVAGDSTRGNGFQGAGDCPSNGPDGWWIPTDSGLRGVTGSLGEGACTVSSCPAPSSDEMIFVVEEWGPSGPPGIFDTAFFIAFRVDGTPGELRAWDLARVAGEDAVLPLLEYPQPIVVSSAAAGPGQFLLDIAYDDVAPSVHAVTEDDGPLPASSVVESYDLYQFVGPPGSTDPGRFASGWTLIDQRPYEDGPATTEVVVTCPPTGGHVFLATGLSFEGGTGPGVASALVGRSIDVDCGPIGVPAPAGAVPDGDAVPGEPLRLEKVVGDVPTLTATWGHSCRSNDVSYAVYEGLLGDFASHVPVTCSTGGALSYSFAPLPGDTYYLVVPFSPPDGAGGFPTEGSYGVTSEAEERPQNFLSACLLQSFGGCP